MAFRRLTRPIAYAWIALISVAVLGPALLPGFVLSYDLVFTPRQDLLPASIGLGSGLPRAVPQDAIVSLAETVLPGSLLEKIVLLAILLLAGFGMLALLRSTAAGVIAATFAIMNPFVAQRLVIGHWGFLIAYALIPWGLLIARRLRERGDAWDGLRLLLVIAAGSLTPSGSVLICATVIPIALLPGSAYSPRRRTGLAAAASATWLPWLLPALLHSGGAASDPDGAAVFSLRSDAPGGVLVSAITGGGIWNAEVVLASRGTALTWVLAVALIGLAIAGAGRLLATQGRVLVGWWAVVGVLGIATALASALVQGPWAEVLDAIPGGGLARDAHKFLAPWMLLMAAAAGMGGARLAQLSRDRSGRVAIVASIALVPLACQIDMLMGAGGRLEAVAYPGDWGVVREVLQGDPRPGDVASFPWTAFRRFAWNADRTVLDPAPRWLPRTTVVADTLTVTTAAGPVDVSGDDPRAAAVSRALQAGAPLAQTLPGLGIGWILVAQGTPGPQPDVADWELVFDGPDLALYAAPEPPSTLRPPQALPLVGAVDAVVLVAVLVGAIALGLRRVRAQRAGRLVR